MPEFSKPMDIAEKNMVLTSIISDLAIQKDEVKMIYEVSLCTKSGIINPYNDKPWWTAQEPPRSFWGFCMLKPEKTFEYDDDGKILSYFTTITVFTPLPGLFTEEEPPA
jgi:hypothetical protein